MPYPLGLDCFTSPLLEMAVMKALGIIDCLAEPHLLAFLVKVKVISGKPP